MLLDGYGSWWQKHSCCYMLGSWRIIGLVAFRNSNLSQKRLASCLIIFNFGTFGNRPVKTTTNKQPDTFWRFLVWYPIQNYPPPPPCLFSQPHPLSKQKQNKWHYQCPEINICFHHGLYELCWMLEVDIVWNRTMNHCQVTEPRGIVIIQLYKTSFQVESKINVLIRI